MKSPKSIYLIVFLCFFCNAFSQSKIKHIVKSGESVYSIAKKYDVKEADIYELNPRTKGALLQLKEVLWIPNVNVKQKKSDHSKDIASKQKEVEDFKITHDVLSKETLYGISKKYKVKVELIKKANPFLYEETLKDGMKLEIPVSSEVYADFQKSSNFGASVKSASAESVVGQSETISNGIIHNVVAKETKYGISKRYGISIEELERLNPKIIKGLSIGDQLIINQQDGAIVSDGNTPIVSSQNNLGNSDSTNVSEVKPLDLDAMAKADFLIAKASENLGVRYRGGGTDRSGFDCSGLMFTTFKNLEMTLPRSSQEMATVGTVVSMSQAQKGDLIFFDTTRRARIGHVGMVTEVLDDEIKFIHSSTSSGVIISSTKEPYYAKRFVQINRVLN